VPVLWTLSTREYLCGIAIPEDERVSMTNKGVADEAYAIIWLPLNRCSECEANSALVTVVSLCLAIRYLSLGWRIFAAVTGVSVLLASS
jgi:hypothetical protein